jgi:hypothetical protein
LDGNTVYAGATPTDNAVTDNYLYKSVDSGSTWTQLTGLTAKGGIRSLAFDPSNHSVLYAGSGDCHNHNCIESLNASGLYRSADGGQTWNPNPLISVVGISTSAVFQIIIDTTTPARIWLLTNPLGDFQAQGQGSHNQIWESVNTGANWNEITPTNIGSGDYLTYAPSEGFLLLATGGTSIYGIAPQTCSAPCSSWGTALTAESSANSLFSGSLGVAAGNGIYEATGLSLTPVSDGGGGNDFTIKKNVFSSLTASSSTYTAATVSALTWSWKAVSKVNNKPVRGYVVVPANYDASSLDSFFSGAVSDILSSTTLSFVEGGLSTNTAHGRVVAAFNNDLSTYVALSKPATFYTAAANPIPSDVDASQLYFTSATINWNAADDTNPAGTKYAVDYWKNQAHASTSTVKAAMIWQTSATVTGLTQNAAYALSVRALNGDKVKTAYVPASFKSLSTFPLPPAAVSGLKVTGVDEASMTWTWKDQSTGKNAAQLYWVYPSTGNKTSNRIEVDAPQHSVTLTGLPAGNTTYGIAVKAENTGYNEESQDSSLSKSVTGYTLASPAVWDDSVTDFIVLGTSLTVSWTEAGQPAKQFKISGYGMKGTSVNVGTVTATIPANTWSHQFKNLKDDATYYFAIQAVNHDGKRSPSDWSVWTSTWTRHVQANGIVVLSLAKAKAAYLARRKGALRRSASVSISPLSDNVRVSIIGKGGVLVKHLPVLLNAAVWDGTDEKGRRVPAGIYRALLETDAEKRFLKIAVGR